MIKEDKDRYNVNVRLSEKQAEQLKVLADKELLSMSGYIRRAVFFNPEKLIIKQ
jgi:hypothetical protein